MHGIALTVVIAVEKQSFVVLVISIRKYRGGAPIKNAFQRIQAQKRHGGLGGVGNPHLLQTPTI